MSASHSQHALPVNMLAQPPPPPPPQTPGMQSGGPQAHTLQSPQAQVLPGGGQFDTSGQQGNTGENQDAAAGQQEAEGELHNVPSRIEVPDVFPVLTDDLQMEQKFRDVLQFIADRADVDLSTPVRHVSDTKVHLLSEQIAPKTEFVSLTTTEALQQLIRAWWGEFKRRDVTPTSQRANKLFALFKNSANKPSLRPYMAADMALTIEPLARPSVNLPWLPQSGRKVELTDFDLQHFERQVRGSLRVVNFMESLLQAWGYGDTPRMMLEKIKGAFVHATKSQMQIQSALFSQIVQLRRDLALQGATAAMDVQQQLRHAPVLNQSELFPPEMLVELNERVKRSYETSIIVQTYRKTQNQRQYDTKGARPWSNNNSAPKDWSRSNSCDTPSPVEPTSPVPAPATGVPFEPGDQWLDQVSTLQKSLDEQKATPVGGRLKGFWKKWKEIGAPKKVYSWFRRGYKLPFSKLGRATAEQLLKTVCPDFLLSKYAFGSIKQKALDGLVAQLLQKGAIAKVPQGTEVVFNRVFLRPKPPKPRQVAPEFRLIIDLSEVNKFLKLKTFSMDTPSEMRKHMELDLWGTSLDLSDAYHHIPIRADFHKFLAFQVGDQQYWYTVCPFGLSPIPQVFTDAMAPLKQFARVELSMVTFQYLDDWLLLFDDPTVAAEKTIKFAQKCLDLGLLVNLDKSELLPTQNITHLGILWDLKNAWVQPSDAQIKSITTGARNLLDAGKGTVKMCESLQGKLVAAEKYTQYGRINYRLFQKFVTRAVQEHHPTRWVRLPWEVLEDLSWWASPKHLQIGAPCIWPKPTVHVTTDASDVGWGAYHEENVMAGKWSPEQLPWHINRKELYVVSLVLEKWGRSLTNQTVQFWLDNRTAVSYISKQGGTKSVSLMLLARNIFQTAHSLNIWLSAAYIPGALNVIADMHSRQGLVLKTEWTLSYDAFQWVRKASLVGDPEIDLFANSHTTQLARFGSPCPELGAELVDALNSDWPDSVLYAFPPTCIMDRVVEKIQKEKPRALLLVTSQFPNATWFPFLTKWEHTVRTFPMNVLQLHQPHFAHHHPNPDTLCLAVYSISYAE